MNSALEALLSKKDKKKEPLDQLVKIDQSEDIRKLIVAISKQEKKMEEMDSEINQLKIDLKEMRENKKTENPKKNYEKKEENKQIKTPIEVPVMNPNNVFSNESMSYVKVVTKNERRKPSIKISENQEKEIIENVSKKNMERLKKRHRNPLIYMRVRRK